jgi:hypothetical protein
MPNRSGDRNITMVRLVDERRTFMDKCYTASCAAKITVMSLRM